MCLRRAQLSVPGSITRDEIGCFVPLSLFLFQRIAVSVYPQINELMNQGKKVGRVDRRGGGGKKSEIS